MGCCFSTDAEFSQLVSEPAGFPINVPASQPPEYDFLFKVIMVGDMGVGKSSLIQRFEMNSFQEYPTKTIGIQFGTRIIKTDEGKKLKIQLWDAEGQMNYQEIRSVYYNNAHGLIFVYDVTDKKSFDHMKNEWYEEVESYIHPNQVIFKMVVANKVDVDEARVIDYQTGEHFAQSIEAKFFETSAKTGQNVEHCFIQLVNDMHSSFLKYFKKNPSEELAFKSN